MNEQPICFQQTKIPVSADIANDVRNSPLSIDNSSTNQKLPIFKNWVSNVNRSRLAVLCILSCSFGALLLMLSAINSNEGSYQNFAGITNVESSNTSEKINFARILGLIFSSPLLIVFFRLYLFILRPLHKKLAPPDVNIDLEL